MNQYPSLIVRSLLHFRNILLRRRCEQPGKASVASVDTQQSVFRWMYLGRANQRRRRRGPAAVCRRPGRAWRRARLQDQAARLRPPTVLDWRLRGPHWPIHLRLHQHLVQWSTLRRRSIYTLSLPAFCSQFSSWHKIVAIGALIGQPRGRCT